MSQEADTEAQHADDDHGSASFYRVRSMPEDQSPHPQAKLHREIKKLSDLLRDAPAAPADPQDARKSWANGKL